jgi:predicted nuclease of predicted toxin-antitoxin system
MKFLADMGISPKTVSFLRDLGHQAVHLHEEGLGRLSDSEILEKARREESIVLTHDLDFGDLLAASGAQLPAVVIFRLRNMRPERVNLYLQNIITHHATALDHGAVATVAEGGVRIRRLPLVANE